MSSFKGLPCRVFTDVFCSLISSIVSLIVSKFLNSSLSRVIRDRRSRRSSAILVGKVSGSNSPPPPPFVLPPHALFVLSETLPRPLLSSPSVVINDLSLLLSLPLPEFTRWLTQYSSSSSVTIEPAEEEPFLCKFYSNICVIRF